MSQKENSTMVSIGMLGRSPSELSERLTRIVDDSWQPIIKKKWISFKSCQLAGTSQTSGSADRYLWFLSRLSEFQQILEGRDGGDHSFKEYEC